ncbi:amino acid adenylation domain-containing protein [Bacillus sp. C1]
MFDRKNVKDMYELSPLQKGMLFHHIKDGSSLAYFEQMTLSIEGSLNLSFLEESVNGLIQKYDILRTNFLYKNTREPMQVVWKEKKTTVHFEDITFLSENQRHTYIEEFKEKDRERGFDLSRDCLIRFSLFKTGPKSFLLVWSHHHILMDGWCFGILFKDLLDMYKARLYHQPIKIETVTPYSDYIRWVGEQDKEDASRYWMEYLEGYDELTSFLYKECQEKNGVYKKEELTFSLNKELTDRLSNLAKKYQVTLNNVFQAAWGILLQRYNDTKDVVFGTVVSGRPSNIRNVESIVGLFINTIPVRVKSTTGTFKDLLTAMHNNALESKTFDYMSLSQIQKDTTLSSLFDHIVVFENYPLDQDMLDKSDEIGFKISDVTVFEQTNYDLNVLVIPNKELEITFSFNEKVFDQVFIKSIFEQLEQIMKQIVERPEMKIDEIEIVSKDTMNQLLEFGHRKGDYPRDRTIHELFEYQVEKTPNHTALILGNDTVTYRELNHRANQLAHYLCKKGIDHGALVGIAMERSIDLYVGILAILKSGGAYVPLDPNYPEERLTYLLTDSQITVLLTHEKFVSNLPNYNGQVICVEQEREKMKAEKNSNLLLNGSGDDLAYVMYTSGSTGKPKGVSIVHRGVVRLVKENDYVQLDESKTLLQLAPTAFDASTFEIWGSLLNGGCLAIMPPGTPTVEQIADALTKHQVTTLWLTAGLFKLVVAHQLEALEGVQQLLVGGDVVSVPHVQKVLQLGSVQVINGYGPTESTTFTCCYSVPADWTGKTLPIGRPIKNTEVYILDSRLKPVPLGVPGELYIGGDGLAREYLNRPDLTQERFIPNPFCTDSKERLYKTGDLVRYLPDGQIEFIERMDNQVKIRGFRIELGEIEAVLSQHQSVKDVVMSVTSEKQLVAYIIPEQDIENQTNQWRQYLSGKLPEYMIPSAFIVMEAFPLNPNGKIDRKALPEPTEHIRTETEFVAPTSQVEEILVEIWKEVLKLKQVGIHDNFFELGGDSINAIQVAARLNRQKLKLELKDLFEYPTIANLAPYIGVIESKISQEIVKGEVQLTPIQKWFFKKNLQEPHHWNQSMMLFKKEGWEIQKVEQVFQTLIAHHDVLRMAFVQGEESITQTNHGLERKNFALQVFDLTKEIDVKASMEKTANQLQRSLHLSEGPIMKAGLFQTIEGEYLLILIHHLVVDGVSWRILLEDFETAYEQVMIHKKIELPPKTTSYQTWAKKLQEYANSEELFQELSYWKDTLETNVPVLPIDKEGSSTYFFKDYSEVTLTLDEKETKSLLTDVHRTYHTEVNDMLLAALVLTIKEWTKDNKIALNLEGHGREEIINGIDLTRTVGWFTSIYPVVFDMPTNELSKIIKSVKETMRCIPNKGIGFGILKYVTQVESKKLMDVNLKPEISFNYLGKFDEEQAEGFVHSSMPMGETISPLTSNSTSLEINGAVMGGQLKLAFGYNPHLYHPETIQNIVNRYKHYLSMCIEHCLMAEEAWTPSDFSMKQLTFEELDSVFEEWKPNEIADMYYLAPMQKGMFFHQLKDKNSPAYFEQIDFHIEGSIDAVNLEESINGLLQKYDIFRTVFLYEKLNQPIQVVLKDRKTTIHFEDISHIEEEEQEKYLEAFKQKDRERGFDLSRDILIRFSLIQTDSEKYHLIWSFHHILIDGWCLGLVLDILLEMYQSRLQKEEILVEKVTPYGKFMKWLEKQNQERAHEHWKGYLQDYNQLVGIPRKERKGKHSDYVEKSLFFKLDRYLTDQLANLAKKCQVTQNTVFRTIWGLLLQRYNNTNDVIFGAVVSGRPSDIRDVENIVGLFINTIPVRIQSEPEETFVNLLKKVQHTSSASEQYTYLSLSDIQSNTELSSGLFDHIVAFENYPLDTGVIEKKSEALGFTIKDAHTFGQTNFDFNVLVLPDDELTVKLSFNQEVYEEDFVENIFKHLEQTVKQVVAQPETQLKEIEIVPSEEKQQLLVEFNDTKVDYPRDKVVHELFEEQVKKTPNHVAVVCGEKQITYQELNEYANQLARVLRGKGVTKEKIVGILVQPSLEMIIGVLGVLKAGGGYLPIDPTYPQERIQYMLTDSQARWLLMQEELEIPAGYTGEVIVLDQEELYQGDGTNLTHINQEHDLAYVIYTSGSTGRPKGVMVEHQSLINLACWHNEMFEVTERDRSTKFAGFGFDASVWEIFPYLVAGASLYMIQEAIRYDVDLLNQYFEEQGITISFLPTQFAEQFMEKDNKSLRILLIGGDRAKLTQERSYRIINNYGPTENTVVTTAYEIEKQVANIPIGKPIANSQIYIVDRFGNLAPIGVAGELCIAGESLARGYLNQPELTAEKFADNPFEPGTKMYKTGDLAKWLPDGNIAFMGRIDHQVKIRGYRIELGEIESVLSQHPSVKAAVVNVTDEDQLVAYIVPEPDVEDQTEQWRQYLSGKLPEYMIPAAFITMDEIPLTSNGKIDKKALPKPKVQNAVEYEAFTNEKEEILTHVWQEVLRVDRIGIHDNFFGLGGDSIKAIQVAARLHKYNLKLEVNDLFQNPTIYEVAPYLKSRMTIEQGTIEGEVEFTPIQKWFIEQEFAEPHHWNQEMMLFRKEGFEQEIVERVFKKLVEHHDVLRMTYTLEKDNSLQTNLGLEGEYFALHRIDLIEKTDVKACMKEEANKLQRGIDLSRGPLVKLGLFHTIEGDYLLIIIHHLVVDGISWRILLEDFETAYQQAVQKQEIKLPLKTTAFQSWAQQLRQYANGEELLRELQYWKEIEESKIPALTKDMDGPTTYSVKDSGMVITTLNEEETKNLLTNSHQAYQTEMNDLLLTALALTIGEWTKENQVAIDLEGHGREEIIDGVDLSRTVGWFTSMYPVIFHIESSELSNMIKSVKEMLRRIPNKGVGYGVLKYITEPENKDDIQFNLKPEISFNYLGQFDKGQGLGQSTMPTGESVSSDTTNSYALLINGMVVDGELKLIFYYNQHLYCPDTIEMLAKQYKGNLLKIITLCLQQEEVELTPSDFSIEELSFEELDDVFDALKEKL